MEPIDLVLADLVDAGEGEVATLER
jgi:hypothetical protein